MAASKSRTPSGARSESGGHSGGAGGGGDLAFLAQVPDPIVTPTAATAPAVPVQLAARPPASKAAAAAPKTSKPSAQKAALAGPQSAPKDAAWPSAEAMPVCIRSLVHLSC
jgi:hypothetical protein